MEVTLQKFDYAYSYRGISRSHGLTVRLWPIEESDPFQRKFWGALFYSDGKVDIIPEKIDERLVSITLLDYAISTSRVSWKSQHSRPSYANPFAIIAPNAGFAERVDYDPPTKFLPGVEYVYFMQCQDTSLIKIGYSNDVERRLSDLRQSTRITLLNVTPGGRILEQRLHQYFANYREYKEWFRPAQPLLDFIFSLDADQANLDHGRNRIPVVSDFVRKSDDERYSESPFSKPAIIVLLAKALTCQREAYKISTNFRNARRNSILKVRDTYLNQVAAMLVSTGVPTTKYDIYLRMEMVKPAPIEEVSEIVPFIQRV
jgi:hypothetical protein